VLRPGKAEDELDRELSSHLTLLEDDFRGRGLSNDEARLAARRAFAGIEQTRDRHRDERSFRWVDELTRDARYGARLLRRNPLFTLSAVASLAVAIGAGTTVFTAANALLFRTAPGVPDPGSLVDINRSLGDVGVEPIPYSQYLEIRDRATRVDNVYAYELTLRPMSLTGIPGQTAAEAVFADRVSPNYFTALGVSAVAGRLFGEQDAGDLIVLSDRFWRRRFNAEASIIGGSLRLNDRLYTIAGVAAESFHGNTVLAPDLWTAADPARPLDFALVGARLKPGTSRSQAAAEVAAIGQSLHLPNPDALPDPMARRRAAPRLTLSRSSPIPAGIRTLIGGFLVLLMAIVAVLLAIASANVAGVLLARATARRREIGIRLALGVGRARLVRQLLTETVFLFGLGGVAGLALSRAMNAAILRLLPSFPLPADAALAQDGRVVAFALVLSFLAALVFGLTPALQASNVDVTSTLKTDEQGPAHAIRVRRAFVVAQIALSVLLAVVGGLLSRALLKTGSPALGFDPRGVEVVSVDLSLGGYTTATGSTFARDLLGRIRQMPDVDGAAIAYATPVGGVMGFQVTVPGETAGDGRPFFDTLGNVVTPGYLAAMRIGLAAGREFSDADSSADPRVAILSEAAVGRFWRGIAPHEAIGRQILWQPMLVEVGTRRPVAGVPLTVVGVARDLTGVNGRAPRPFVYLPLDQQYMSTLKILTRTSSGHRLARDVRALITTMDPRLPALSAGTLDDEGSPVMTQLRVAAILAGSLGICGLLLAAMGIYGLTAYLVTRRTREIGVRIALGAERGDLIRMVLAEGMQMAVTGSALGFLLAAGASRLLTSLLFGVPPLDPLTFGGVIVLFAAIALAASYGPVRRALRINPVEALRYE